MTVNSGPITDAERTAIDKLGHSWLAPAHLLEAYRAGYRDGLRDGEASMCRIEKESNS
jgi:hypothetical protein